MATTEKINNILMSKSDMVSPTGKYTAWATADGMRAVVMHTANDLKSIIVKQFKGETAWSDADREAGDLNSQAMAQGR